MNRRSVLTVLTSTLVFSAVGRAQGFYVESIHAGNDKAMDRFYFMPKMLKTVDRDGRISIFRLDKETFYNIDPAKKSYTGMTFAEMKGMMGKAKSKLGDVLEKRLEQLPPDQRKKMEERMGAMMNQSTSPNVTYQVQATGENKSISGYNCEKYIVKRNGKEFETIWATKQISGFESIKRDMADLTERLSSAIGTKGAINLWYKDIDGFPIQTESYGSVSVATKIERKTIPTSEFEVPAGYTKEKNKMEEALNSGKD